MKADEVEFFIDIYMQPNKKPRDIINEDGFYIHHKRAWYILEKWTRKGWYDYGVASDLGWLTEEGEKYAIENIINP